MYNISGDNPTTLYKNVVDYVSENGDKISPRGKLVSEVRPACIEFLNPLNRVTFLATRRINPFFQLAESFQIISGVNDAKWLSKFNANMLSFSDDGETFNAFYGERIRHWGDDKAHNTAAAGRDGEGALDQFKDCYLRLLEDKDTRQAAIAIGNPTFDNYKYLNEEYGKDVACLPGDTLVSTPDGDIPIKDIKVGQTVYSFDRCFHEVKTAKVTASAKTRKNAEILELKTFSDSVRCTPDHVLYVERNGRPSECQADQVKVGDMLYLFSEGNLGYKFMTKSAVRSIELLEKRDDVYDITVDDYHNFFADRILVHNCNLYITFKIRGDKLHTTVFNRSNDVHWGTFGANLPQFTTIQEAMCSCLKNSGKDEFKNLEVGSYNQITDSLHIYLDDYGAKITDDVVSYYEEHPYEEFNFQCADEPRMEFDIDTLYDSFELYWDVLDKYVMKDDINASDASAITSILDKMSREDKPFDPYLAFTIKAMVTYRLIKNKHLNDAIDIMYTLPNCQWKISMMYFMKRFIEKVEDEMDRKILIGRFGGIVHNISMSLIDQSDFNKKQLFDYLSF